MVRSKIKNQISVGVDIERTARFIGKKINSPFLKRLYTPGELNYCFNKQEPSESLAGRFAAKESVKKALAPLIKQPVDHKDIEILNNELGVPLISVENRVGDKFNFSLSISHTKNTAIAVVIATPK